MNAVSSLVGVRYGARTSPRRRPRGHVESYFLKANDPIAPRAIWIKTTIYVSPSGAALAEAWAVAFDGARGHVAVKTSVPFERARFARDRVDAEVDGVTMRGDGTRGAIDSGGRKLAWDVALSSDGLPIVHYPHPWMYEGKFPSSKIVSPYPDLRATGWIDVEGERWTIDKWPGLLGHNWGPRHAPLYAWGHGNVWQREDGGPEPELIFEGVSGKVKVGPTLSPLMTLLCLRWRGTRFDLNGTSDLVTNRGEVTPRRWSFEGENRHVSLRGELWASTDDFVGLFYENPGDVPTHCLNSKLAHGRLAIEVKGRPPITVTTRAAALEIGTTDPSHGVRMYV